MGRHEKTKVKAEPTQARPEGAREHVDRRNMEYIMKLHKMKDEPLLREVGVPPEEKINVTYRPLKYESILWKLTQYESYAQNFGKNMTVPFLRELIYDVRKNINIELCVFNFHQRSYKSTCGMSVGRFITSMNGYDLTVGKDIFASQIAYLSAVPERAFSSVAVVDETHKLRAQLGAYLVQEELEDIQKIIAKELLHSIRVTRSIDSSVTAHYGLETLGSDEKTGVMKALLYDLERSEYDMKSLLGYVWFPPYDPSVVNIDHFQLEHIPDTQLTPAQKFRLDYERKKDMWNEAIKYRKVGERALERLRLATELTKDPLFANCKNQGERHAVARFLLPQGYGEEELDEVVRFARDSKILAALCERVGVPLNTDKPLDRKTYDETIETSGLKIVPRHRPYDRSEKSPKGFRRFHGKTA